MRILFCLIHTAIIAYIVITGNDLYDQILSGIIAVIAFIYAFIITGRIAGSLGYNSILMSFFHWFIRTIITVAMILITRVVFGLINGLIEIVSGKNSEIIAIVICITIWIVFAEVLKSDTKLNKRYW